MTCMQIAMTIPVTSASCELAHILVNEASEVLAVKQYWRPETE